MSAKEMRFPVSSVGIRDGLDALLTRADEIGVPRSLAHRIAVIVDEYCSNLIRHDSTISNGSLFEIQFSEVPGGARVVIRDRGAGFDPTTHVVQETTGIGGQGISLIRGLATELNYHSDLNGNVLEATILADRNSEETS